MSGVGGPGDPRLESALRALAGADVAPGDSEARLARARATVRGDRGLIGAARSLSTPARGALVGVALAALVGVVLVFNARGDLAVYPTARLVAEAALSGGFALILAGVALRGPHRATPGPGLTWTLAGLALAVPALLAVIPPADLMLPGAKGGEGTLARDAAACFGYGVAASLPVLGVLAVLQRLPPTTPRAAAMAAVGAGLGGVLALQMHCPIAVRDHLFLGHASVPLAALLAVLLVRRLTGGPS